ncbi:alcohol dehydrogenase-like protein [Paraphoma chrysanthemicola]|uniref:Alcohol dehydrogenase-like protein n=1 Tax=Paraphoma chrysanthemicola TaxID=798071 RepID=A0A8K0R3C7_9PLEO|nr:alcohol dehydrogenase-like protein [Paraphoma chrysanthemicola]
MLEAIVQTSLEVAIVQSPVPTPGKGQVLIKVVCSGCNPKDWKLVVYEGEALNSGDDIAGVVESTGPDVTEFKRGDRVAAFHPMRTSGGSFAEFAIAPAATTFHLPPNISFEEGSTVPLAALTAAVALYHSLGLSNPWMPATTTIPILIYGASTAVGAYAIKLASRSNLHPIIAIAGKGRALVERLIDTSKGDVIIDYREGNEIMARKIREALASQGQLSIAHALDCVAEPNTLELLADVVAPKGHATFVLHERDYNVAAKTLRTSITFVGYVHTGPFQPEPWQGINYNPEGRGEDFGFIFTRLLSKGLQEGWLTPHPHELIPDGLKGLSQALKNMRDGKLSAMKYAVRIGDANL